MSFTPQTEGQYPGDWLRSEAQGSRSREQITILAGSGSARALTSGMVLGKVTASGKYTQIAPGLSDGSQTAAGILLFDATAPNGTDVQATAILRDAEVSQNGLTWPVDSDLVQATQEANLETLGIQVRPSA